MAAVWLCRASSLSISSWKSKWYFFVLSVWHGLCAFLMSCLIRWPVLAECMWWTWNCYVRLWPHFPSQFNLDCTHFATEAAAFLLFTKEQSRYLEQHKPWFLNQPHPSYGMGSKREVTPIKPDLCQPVMPSTNRRLFNKSFPSIAEHCYCCPAVLQPQALPCDPAWQEYVTQCVLSWAELDVH